MGESQARALATSRLAEWQEEYDRVARLHNRAPGTLLVITRAQRISRTWCIFYNDERYLDMGNVSFALAGNGPILVAGSALPADHYVAEFEHRE